MLLQAVVRRGQLYTFDYRLYFSSKCRGWVEDVMALALLWFVIYVTSWLGAYR